MQKSVWDADDDSNVAAAPGVCDCVLRTHSLGGRSEGMAGPGVGSVGL